MPRDLFGDVTRPPISIGSRKWYTLPVSPLSHSFAVGLLIALPILAPSLLPTVLSQGMTGVVIDMVPPTPPPPPIRPDVPKQPDVNPNAAPTEAPPSVGKEPDVVPGFERDRPGVEGGFVIGAVEHGIVELAARTPVASPAPLQIGGSIRAPQKVVPEVDGT